MEQLYRLASELHAERMAGVSTLILTTYPFLSIPLANDFPGPSIITLALGLVGRDGYWFSGGTRLTLGSPVIVTGVASQGSPAIQPPLFIIKRHITNA